MKNILKITIVTCVCLIHSTNYSYATSCRKEYSSLEKTYLMADVIFSGYVVPNKEKNITKFKVTEFFKTV